MRCWWLWSMLALAASPAVLAGSAAPPARPNILWISAEDLSQDLGCYGDRYAVTPNLDKFAAQGVRYQRAYAHTPVCAPSRSALITGRYATSIGSSQMRCQAVPPPGVKCFPEYLRAAGYYCTNNVKTDYQFAVPPTAWDASSNQAHWKNRPAGKPFFSVFNLTTTHESQIRSRAPGLLARIQALGPTEKHDPAGARVPPYHPDTPAVRKDWAQYYDCITLMDKEVGQLLRELEEAGLADDTIVWFWGDHGRGLPRCKRWPYESGLRVPLLVRVPEKWRRWARPDQPDALKPGTIDHDLVGFIDFAPTMLRLAGVPIPEGLDGQPFLGPGRRGGREFVVGYRDRMDEAYDTVRTVRDRRFRYIRHFQPFLPYAQDVAYMNEMPTMAEMRRLHADGKLIGTEKLFFRATKPVEELFDTEADPDEVKDLAGDPKYAAVLAQMRSRLRTWMRETHDLGLLPEAEWNQRARPFGRRETTAAPGVRFAAPKDGGAATVTLSCQTPGASLEYRLEDDRTWHLYTAPLHVPDRALVAARANRIGFADSSVVSTRVTVEAAPTGASAGERWSADLRKSGLLDELLALKDTDLQPLTPVVRDRLMAALDHQDAAVRFWGALGVRHRVVADDPAGPREPVRRKFRLLLSDPSAAVRAVVAEALGAWGPADDLAAAVKVLENQARLGQEFDRLAAVIALGRLGRGALPALATLRAGRRDESEYVKRVCEAAVNRLERGG